MSDVFISYSHKHGEQAQTLAQLLTSAGLSVWIDKSGLEVASSWSRQIVDAMNECSVFVLLPL
jgi:hypothetical protein